MENFVFPDEIDKTKLMKMNDKHFFVFTKIMEKCCKLYAFSFITYLKTSWKRPILQPHHSFLETLDQTGNHIQTTPRIPSFW